MTKLLSTSFIVLILSPHLIQAQNFHLVKDINTASNSDPSSFRAANGIIYFAANDGIHGKELWRTDGTDTGTYMVKDINEGTESSSPADMTESNGKIYFKAYTSVTGTELFRTDGTLK